MSKRKLVKPPPITLTAAEAKIIATVAGNDGHSIKRVLAFNGVNAAFLAAVTYTHKSSRTDPKHAITDTQTGLPVDTLTGIYTLDILRAACNVLKLPHDADQYFGRGRMAFAYTAAIWKFVRSAGL